MKKQMETILYWQKPRISIGFIGDYREVEIGNNLIHIEDVTKIEIYDNNIISINTVCSKNTMYENNRQIQIQMKKETLPIKVKYIEQTKELNELLTKWNKKPSYKTKTSWITILA